MGRRTDRMALGRSYANVVDLLSGDEDAAVETTDR